MTFHSLYCQPRCWCNTFDNQDNLLVILSDKFERQCDMVYRQFILISIIYLMKPRYNELYHNIYESVFYSSFAITSLYWNRIFLITLTKSFKLQYMMTHTIMNTQKYICLVRMHAVNIPIISTILSQNALNCFLSWNARRPCIDR